MPLARLKIVLKTGQAEVALSVEEARELFEQLRALLGEPVPVPAPPVVIQPVCRAPHFPPAHPLYPGPGPTWATEPTITFRA